MKIFGKAVVLGAGALAAAAHFMPGFWGHVPLQVRMAVPPALHKYVNLDPQRDLPPPLPVNQAMTGMAGMGGMSGMSGMAGKGGKGGGQGAGGGQNRPVPVLIAKSVRKSMPFRVDSIGTVQAIASVTLRPRVDSQIEQVLFQDGARVTAGEVLVKLDSRALEAQIKQAEANLARDRANLSVAQQTLKRTETLSTQSFATQQKLDENRGAVAALDAQVKADIAQVDNLKTQLGYYTITAPITGKASVANLKPGNIAQAAAAATPLTTIVQMAPIYVSFSLPQRVFDEVRESLKRGDSVVDVTPQGSDKVSIGKLSMVENTMDNATGTVAVRAILDNADEALWPGAVVNLKATLRTDQNVVTVPREAVQMSQQGQYVFVVTDGIAKMRPVSAGRAVDRDIMILSGLDGGEQVIVDGHLLVNDGARVQPRQGQTSAAPGGETTGKL